MPPGMLDEPAVLFRELAKVDGMNSTTRKPIPHRQQQKACLLKDDAPVGTALDD